MQWLNKLVDEITAGQPEGEVLIESGSSPSGTYHLGHLREVITCDAILLELRRRGRQARHIAYVDDLDALRKIPLNVPANFEQYLGKSLCDIPSPEGDGSYADYFLRGLLQSAKTLGIEMEVMRSHEKYREGFYVPSIETALENIAKVRKALEEVSGRTLDENWSPIQINEGGYLKKRRFLSIDKDAKTIEYEDKDGSVQSVGYAKGEVKLDWRIDWPARWHQLGVKVEPSGRDHSTKGGSYDTGAAISQQVFGNQPPLPVAYDFVNMAGDTKKMSASKGTGLDAAGVVEVLPPEIVRYFMLRYPPSKRLYFDPVDGVAQLIDDYAQLVEEEPQSQLIDFSRRGLAPIISRVSFSHLVASYQASLKDPNKTLDIIKRTDGQQWDEQNQRILNDELKYIDQWLDKWAPDDMKFELSNKIEQKAFTEGQKAYFKALAEKIATAPSSADGEWFHKVIYDLKDGSSLEPKEMFTSLYKLLIGKASGPRAGWFLSILPRDWLIKRLRLES